MFFLRERFAHNLEVCRPLFFWTPEGLPTQVIEFLRGFHVRNRNRAEIYFMLYSHFHRLHVVSWFCSMAKATKSVHLIVSVTKPYIKFTGLFSAQSASNPLPWTTSTKSRCVSHTYRFTLKDQRLNQHLKTWLLLPAVPLTSVYKASLPKLFLDLLITVVIFLERVETL